MSDPLTVQLAADWAPNTTSLATAMAQGTLGIGFGASGFLILFHTGVFAILQSLGILSSTMRLAGSSGGSIHAAAMCVGSTLQQQYNTNFGLSVKCRASKACRGSLDAEVRKAFSALVEQVPGGAAAFAGCRGRLYVGVTDYKTDTGLLVGPNWSSNEQLINGIAASSFIPGISAPFLATSALSSAGIAAAADGGFTNKLPSPPGTSYTITVSPNTLRTAREDAPDYIDEVLRGQGATAARPDVVEAADVGQPPRPDIYPGLSGPLTMPASTWNKYGLNIPDDATLRYIFNRGRLDAAAFVRAHGLASEAAIQAALGATAIAALEAGSDGPAGGNR